MDTIYKKPNHQILLMLVGAFSVFQNTEMINNFISSNNINVEVSPSDVDEDGMLKSVRFIHQEWILDCQNELGMDISVYLRPITDRPGIDYWLSYSIKAYSIKEEKAYDYDEEGKELIYTFNDKGILI